MVSTWIETAAKGRHGGPVRAGIWSACVIGTHPIEANQEVWLELAADEVELGPLPAYWVENKGVNSLWHVPIPPQAVGARLRKEGFTDMKLVVPGDETVKRSLALAQVTDQYLAYILQMQVPADEISAFLVVAAKLLQIKSEALLPRTAHRIAPVDVPVRIRNGSGWPGGTHSASALSTPTW